MKTKKKKHKKHIRKPHKKPGDRVFGNSINSRNLTSSHIRIIPGLKAGPGINKFRLDQLDPADYNPRTIDAEAMAGLTNSISKFGCVEPIIVNIRGRHNVIVGGNQRFKALQSLGVTECLCVTVNCSRADEKLLNLTLNNPLIQGEFVKNIVEYIEKLRQELSDDSDFLDLRIVELQNELGRFPGKAGKISDDDIPKPPKKAITKTGDLWILGKHRLLCGDSTKEINVKRLMGKKRANMVFTDPPYGVSYDGGRSNKTKRKAIRGDDDTNLYSGCCKQAFRFSTNNAALYLWHAGVKGIAAAAAATAARYEIRCELIWHKLNAHYGAFAAQYMQKHEPCYYCYKRNQTAQWFGPPNEVTVWEVEQPHKNEYHPTQKPVILAERAIKNSSKQGQIILDLFLGSGSTLIGCEKLNRKCYGMEIDPFYCDVIIKRWELRTGTKAKRERR